ncbi:50S ribosomal protein L9 [Opitutia bacterium KCR 482]|nr:50S ribosomal protein L9 [Opitutae bacterium KCR 482]MDY5583198.1 50S ribosomal protein L9 [Candidatus Merdousia sp.]
MAISKVLLVKPVENLGGEGEQVSVKAGYARNFLYPQKIAIPVSKANKKQIEALIKARELREAKELENAQALSKAIEGMSIAFAVKTGEGGKMFGSVTVADIVAKIAEGGIELPKKAVHLAAPVKELGKHTAQIKLHKDVKIDIHFEVVSENPIEDSAKESN